MTYQRVHKRPAARRHLEGIAGLRREVPTTRMGVCGRALRVVAGAPLAPVACDGPLRPLDVRPVRLREPRLARNTPATTDTSLQVCSTTSVPCQKYIELSERAWSGESVGRPMMCRPHERQRQVTVTKTASPNINLFVTRHTRARSSTHPQRRAMAGAPTPAPKPRFRSDQPRRRGICSVDSSSAATGALGRFSKAVRMFSAHMRRRLSRYSSSSSSRWWVPRENVSVR